MKQLAGYLFKALSFVVTLLPLGIRMKLGDFLGLLWFDVFRIRRDVAVENVGIAFPEKSMKERERIARASLKSMGRTLIEYMAFPYFKEKDVSRYFAMEGLEHVHEAQKAGKGVIFLTLHLGNGDFATAALSRSGLKVHLISKEFKAKWLNELWFGMRSKHGTRFISPEKSSFDILRALRRNEIVIFVLDQFMGPPVGVRTRFFGKETGTALGCALMAERTRAPVIPRYIYRLPDGRHRIVFDKAIPYLDESLRDENVAIMTQVYTDKIEAIVRHHPEQWMWIHRRWKEFRD